MPKFDYLSPGPAGLLKFGDVARVADSLRRGGLAVLPTETGYMLAAVATSEAAVVRVFEVKQRDLAHSMHVAVASLVMAEQVGELTPAARRLMEEFTPGPVTVVVPQTDLLPRRA